jgi:hypothetical protein
MSILDEIKKLTHPYEDEDDDPAEFEDELEMFSGRQFKIAHMFFAACVDAGISA